MDVLTRSSSARARNEPARLSVLVGLLGILVPPAGFMAARQLASISVVQATMASCASAVLGVAAIVMARRGRRNIERTIGRVGGEGTARVGRVLGVISFCLGLTAALALGFYGLLNLFG